MSTNKNSDLRLFLTIGGLFLTQTLIFGFFLNACRLCQKAEENFVEKNSQKQQENIQPQKISPWVGYMYGGAISGCLISTACILTTRQIFR